MSECDKREVLKPLMAFITTIKTDFAIFVQHLATGIKWPMLILIIFPKIKVDQITKPFPQEKGMYPYRK